MNIDRRDFLRMAGGNLLCFLSPIIPSFENIGVGSGVKLKDAREFLTDRNKLKHFSTLQFDSFQYPGLTDADVKRIGQNSCGLSTIATSYNIMERLWGNPWKRMRIGEVRSFVLEDLNNSYYDDISKTKREFIQAGGTMYFYDLIKAYSKLGFETVGIFGDEYSGIYTPQLITYARAGKLADQIKTNVFDKGGILVGFSTVYNGHFLLITDFKPIFDSYGNVLDLELFVIDGRGWDGKGIIGKVRTSRYSPFSEVAGGKKILTTGLIGLAGVLPI